MQGLFLDVLRRASDDIRPGAWASAAQVAGLPTHPAALTHYDEAASAALFRHLGEAMGTDRTDALVRIGQRSVGILAADMPAAFAPHDSVEAFLASLEAVIHGAVRASDAAARPPRIAWSDGVVLYRSERRLGALAWGLLLGVARHYGGTHEVRPMDPLDRDAVRFQVTRR